MYLNFTISFGRFQCKINVELEINRIVQICTHSQWAGLILPDYEILVRVQRNHDHCGEKSGSIIM